LKTLTINFKCGFDVEAMIIGMLVYSAKLILYVYKIWCNGTL